MKSRRETGRICIDFPGTASVGKQLWNADRFGDSNEGGSKFCASFNTLENRTGWVQALWLGSGFGRGGLPRVRQRWGMNTVSDCRRNPAIC